MTTSVVIDAGVLFKLLVPNQGTASIKRQFRGWMQEGFRLCAPSLWIYEITSIFTKSVHFGELTEGEADAALSHLLQLDVQLIEPDEEQIRTAFGWTMRLHRAAAYDSFYLAAAEKLGCDLWTADERLVHAVGQPWVKLAV